MWYSNPGKTLFLDITYINIHTLVSSLYQCVETCSQEVFRLCLSHFRTSVLTSSSSAKLLPCFSTQLWNALRNKHFLPWSWNISLWISFALSPFAHRKRTTERCSSVVQTSSTVAVLTTETNLWTCMFVCYIHCHKAGLCCYLVRHMYNLIRPLQLFYFHLWPIYWLSLV
jgi:hypothetical protein